jgi:hypothetical protein
VAVVVVVGIRLMVQQQSPRLVVLEVLVMM